MTHAEFIRTLPLIALVVLMTFTSLVATPAWSQSSSSDTQQGTPSGAGMQAGAAVSTILYFLSKPPLQSAEASSGAGLFVLRLERANGKEHLGPQHVRHLCHHAGTLDR